MGHLLTGCQSGDGSKGMRGLEPRGGEVLLVYGLDPANASEMEAGAGRSGRRERDGVPETVDVCLAWRLALAIYLSLSRGASSRILSQSKHSRASAAVRGDYDGPGATIRRARTRLILRTHDIVQAVQLHPRCFQQLHGVDYKQKKQISARSRLSQLSKTRTSHVQNPLSCTPSSSATEPCFVRHFYGVP